MVSMFNLLSALFAGLAAIAWIYSSMAKGYPTDSTEPRPPGPSYPTPQSGMGRDSKGRQYELFATLRLQSKWERICGFARGGGGTFSSGGGDNAILLWPAERGAGRRSK